MVRKAPLGRARRIVDGAGIATLVRRDWASRLLAHPRRADKALAALLLAPLAASHPAEVERAVLRLARDDRWDVRELAETLLGEALEVSFAPFAGAAAVWVAREGWPVRRVVVRAIARAARSQTPPSAERMLDLIEPAMRDPHEQVRRAVTLGALDQLLRCDPPATIARLERWSVDRDETMRANVAVAFASPAGARHAERGLPLLRVLAADGSRPVARAAAATLRRLAQPRPGRSGA